MTPRVSIRYHGPTEAEREAIRADRIEALLCAAAEAKILIGARNDNLSEAVREGNVNKAWWVLDAAIAKARPS